MVRILEETAFVSPDLGVNKSNNSDWKSMRDNNTHTHNHTDTHSGQTDRCTDKKTDKIFLSLAGFL